MMGSYRSNAGRLGLKVQFCICCMQHAKVVARQLANDPCPHIIGRLANLFTAGDFADAGVPGVPGVASAHNASRKREGRVEPSAKLIHVKAVICRK
jgi:hypothetical protein